MYQARPLQIELQGNPRQNTVSKSIQFSQDDEALFMALDSQPAMKKIRFAYTASSLFLPPRNPAPKVLIMYLHQHGLLLDHRKETQFLLRQLTVLRIHKIFEWDLTFHLVF